MTTTKKKAKAPTLAQRVKALECDAEELRHAGVNLENRVATSTTRLTALEVRDMAAAEAIQGVRNRLYALEEAQRPAECSICRGDGVYVSPSLGSEIECPNCGPSVSRNPPTRAEKPATEKRAGPWVDFGCAGGNRANAGVVGSLVCGVGPANAVGNVWRAWTVNADGLASKWWGTQYSTEALARAACDAELVRLGWTLDEAPAPPAPSEESRLRDAVVDAALAWGGPGWLGPSRMIDATAALRAHRAKKGGA